MTKQEYFKFAEKFYNNALEVSKKKNADYTGGSDDPFSNFSSVEILGISTEVGFLTRMFDKMKRISSFVKNGELQVKDESVMDTLSDLSNYACLFAGYLQSKKEKIEVNFLASVKEKSNEQNSNIKLPDSELPFTKIPGDRSIHRREPLWSELAKQAENGSRPEPTY